MNEHATFDFIHDGNLLAIGLGLVSKITQLQIFLDCFFATAIECLLLIQVAKMPSSWAIVFINAFGIPWKKDTQTAGQNQARQSGEAIWFSKEFLDNQILHLNNCNFWLHPKNTTKIDYLLGHA